jgi:hypothetical protein
MAVALVPFPKQTAAAAPAKPEREKV